MPKEPFEEFIKNLLDRHARADQLRNINSSHSNSFLQSIEGFLLEEELAAQFDPEGYNDSDRQDRVLSKLKQLIEKLNKALVPTTDARYITVKLCIDYVDRGYALTDDIVDYLNRIYHGY